ncbi:MAG: GNAT family N-acetyltransferase [Pikeienuella sp.]
MLRFLQERGPDAAEVETLLDLAFAPGRELLSSYQLRAGVAPVAELCQIVRDDYDTLVGCIRYWPVMIGGSDGPAGAAREPGWPALLLGPIAVHPIRQGEGIGAALMRDTLSAATASGWARVLLVGDAPYYTQFGFSRAAAQGLVFPQPVNEARVLARALVPGGMAGVSGPVHSWPDPAAKRH